jgi:hypothetical protein
MAAQSSSAVAPFSIETQGYDGGINLRDAWNQIAPNEARTLENGILDEKGGFSKRMGCVSNGTFNSPADRILSQYTFYRGVANPPQVIIHTTAGSLYYTNDPTANPVVWGGIVAGVSTSVPMSFETFAGNCYFCNGVDNYAKWDGATYTAFPTAPKGKYLRLWKDTMFVSGVTGLPDRVYESAAGDAENWPVASWIDLAKGDGDSVKALASDGFTLIVGKLRRTIAMTDPATLANRLVDYEKGFESHFAVQQHEGNIYFLSRRGICRYLGDSPSEIISFKIDPLFDPAVINLNALESSRSYVVDNRVCFAIPEVGATSPSMQICYYPRLGPLSPYGTRGLGPWTIERLPATTFSRWRWQGNDFIFGGSRIANKFYRLYAPVGTDDGATIVGMVETGALDFGTPTHTKYLRRIRVLGRGNVNLQIRRNYQTGFAETDLVSMGSTLDFWSLGDLWGSGTWGPDSVIKEVTINPDIYARAFSLRFVDSEVTVGTKLIEVGSTEYSLPAGEWAVYAMVLDGNVLGLR